MASIAIAVQQQFETLDQQSHDLLGSAYQQLDALASLVDAWHVKRERLELLRSAGPATMGALADVPEMRELLVLAYVERARTALAAVLAGNAALCTDTMRLCARLQLDLVAAIDKHLRTPALTAAVCERVDGRPALSERIDGVERRVAIVRGICCVVAELQLARQLSIDSDYEQLGAVLQRLDQARTRHQ